MNEESKLKRRMLEKQQQLYQQQMMQQAAGQQHAINQQLEMLKMIMTEILEPKARERLNNLKMVKPDVATQVEIYLAQAYQSGQLQQKITEEQLIAILSQIEGKHSFKITRK
ncbi:MAG: DNA-binding protein [Candidatus Aenigmarchaeota archaeon]|nr:DNA-binding protein [Candidatus Aenigmarchaeota archaeon]